MIFKDQLLDAYMTLSGSWSQHLAMLLTIFFIMPNPSDLSEDGYNKEGIEWLNLMCILLHSFCFAVKLLMKWDMGRNSKLLQTIDALLVIMQIYLVLICIENYSTMEVTSINQGNKYDPDTYFIDEDYEVGITDGKLEQSW